MIEDDSERARLHMADGAVQALEAQAVRTDVPLLDRYGLPEGQVSWRVWPAQASAGANPPAVLLVHGGSGSWTHWLRTIPALRLTHTVLAADIPGYGDSGRVPGGTPVDGLAERLVCTLEAVWPAERGPLAVVGFSFGAIVAGHAVAQWLQADAHRVRQLVIVGAVGLGITRTQPIALKPWRWVEDLDELRGIHTDNLLALMLKHPASVDAVAIALQDANARRTRYVSKRQAQGTALADVLRDLPVPVHGIWGDADPTADDRVAQVPALLAECHPGAMVDVIPDCGHWAMWERPEAFNALLARALSA